MSYPSWRRSLPCYVPETGVLRNSVRQQLPGLRWAKSSFRIEHGWDFRNPVPSERQGWPRKRTKEYKGEIIIRKIYKRPQRFCDNRRCLKRLKNHTCCYCFRFRLFPVTVQLAEKEFPPFSERSKAAGPRCLERKREDSSFPFSEQELLISDQMQRSAANVWRIATSN